MFIVWLCAMPEGTRCRAKSRPSGNTTVCPALLPPLNRATTLLSSASISTKRPFPSSPLCSPTITSIAMSIVVYGTNCAVAIIYCTFWLQLYFSYTLLYEQSFTG